jgi:hypothetical protein
MKNNEAPLEPATVAALLRNNVFNLKIEDIGLTQQKSPAVWGVMMELGYPEVVVSLTVLADGSCSVYLSDGNGAVGCGLYSEVRQTVANMLGIAQRMIPQCETATDYPLPANSQVRFYLFTGQGILTAAHSRHDMDEGATELAELYYAGHSVIGMIELLDAGIDIIDEMRLAQGDITNPVTDTVTSGIYSMPISRSRGRACRILPSVGSAARRWHN